MSVSEKGGVVSVAHGTPMTAAETMDSSPGFFLLDARMRPLFANSEAVRILAYPKRPQSMKSLSGLFAKRINGRGVKGELPSAQELVSGRRHYWCRCLALDSENPSAPVIAVLMERGHQPATLLPQMAQRFHFTDREQEVVKLLIGGLTTREIAGRMGVSPNTVKAFLRLVMIKMGVESRSAILGRILRT